MAFPDGEGRFTDYTSTNHSAWLWVVTIFCIVFSLAMFLFRVRERLKTYSFDDIAATLTFIFVMIHSALLLTALHDGIGKVSTTEDGGSITRAAEVVYGSRLVFALILWTSKCSVLLTIRRMITIRAERWLCDTGMVVATVWCLTAMIAVNAGCEASQTVMQDAESSCAGMDVRLAVVVTLDMLTECLLFGLAVFFFRNLQMPIGKKMQVLAGFGLRLGNIPLAIGFLICYLRFLHRGASSIGFIPTLVIKEIAATYSFFSVMAISLARFVKEFHTYGGSVFDMTNSRRARYKRSTQSTQSTTIKGSTMDTTSTRLSDLGDNLRPEQTSHRTKIFASAARTRPHADSEGSQGGIVKEETFEIDSQVNMEGRSEPT